jgi:hypothetical protein
MLRNGSPAWGGSEPARRGRPAGGFDAGGVMAGLGLGNRCVVVQSNQTPPAPREGARTSAARVIGTARRSLNAAVATTGHRKSDPPVPDNHRGSLPFTGSGRRIRAGQRGAALFPARLRTADYAPSTDHPAQHPDHRLRPRRAEYARPARQAAAGAIGPPTAAYRRDQHRVVDRDPAVGVGVSGRQSRIGGARGSGGGCHWGRVGARLAARHIHATRVGL